MTNLHGDEYQGVLKANFSSNVWQGADNTDLFRHLAAQLPGTRRYPETEAESLREILSQILTVNTLHISIGNGSIEIIYRIAQAFQGKKSIIVTPSFSEYSKACSVNEHKVRLCYRENLKIEIEYFQPDTVWICNPNNPDGHCMDRKELQAVLYTYPKITFIIDQSFADFTMQETLAADSVIEFNNLILIYSLTKRYAIPGLRLGYVVAAAAIINRLDRYKIPWSVNTLAIEAGKYLLKKQDTLFNLPSWLDETIRFQKGINRIGIFNALPTHTPYFLVILLQGKTCDLKRYLLKESILIRDATNFDYKNMEIMRLNTLTKDQNNLLLKKLRIWKQNLLLQVP